MAALYAIWKPLSRVQLGGVNYAIGVKQREDGRFSVAWVCLKCCEQGPPAPATETLERAVAFAQIGLRAHHGFFHRDAKLVAGSNGPSGTIGALAFSECRPPEHRHAAYECARAVFKRLCSAHAKLRLGGVDFSRFKNSDNSHAATSRDWKAVACEFREALDAYSRELSKRPDQLHVVEATDGRARLM
jgi:hypothetical protein